MMQSTNVDMFSMSKVWGDLTGERMMTCAQPKPRPKTVTTEAGQHANTSVATYKSTLNGTLDGLHFSLTFRRCAEDPMLSGASVI